MKIIFTAMLLTGCLAVSTARAEMLYQFKFEGADDAARLKSTGTQKVAAELKKMDGQSVKFHPDTPGGSGNSAEFTFRPGGKRGAMLLVPGSREKVRFSKAGEKLSLSLWIRRANEKEGGILGNFSGNGKTGWLLSVLENGSIRSVSTGQLRRAFLARALMGFPLVLLLDEACTGLDVRGRLDYLDVLDRLVDEGLSYVFVSHYREDIPTSINRTALMREGRLEITG